MRSPSAPPEAVVDLAALLAVPRSIVITTHYNPDGDALGSSLGLMRILEKAGHKVRVVLPNTPPFNLQWMPGYANAMAFDRGREIADATVRGSEVLFCLDFNRSDRVSGLEQALRAAPLKVIIDHHRDPDTFARITFSDTSACATSQMIFDIVDALGMMEHLDADAATCLYAGIMTDSGSFRFSSTTPHTLEVAAELMRRGAVPDSIHSAIMDDNTEDRLRLLGFALQERLVVHADLRTAVVVLTAAELDRFNFQPGDTEGLVNYGLSIRGIRLAAFIVERPEVVKISMRSKGTLPVNEFLHAHFNGGGHANAAGGHAKEPLADVVARFMRELPAFLAKHPV